MADPFTQLHRFDEPVEPTSEFRARITQELAALAANTDQLTARNGGAAEPRPGEDQPRQESPNQNPDANHEEKVVVTLEQALLQRPGIRRRWAALGAVAAALALAVGGALVVSGDGDKQVDVGDATVPFTTSPAVEEAPTGSTTSSTAGAGDPGNALPPLRDPAGASITSFAVSQFNVALKVINDVAWIGAEAAPPQRYDTRSGASLGAVELGTTTLSNATHSTVAFGSVWVAWDVENVVWRLDATTGAVQASFSLPGDIPNLALPAFDPIAATPDSLLVVGWTNSGNTAAVYRIDPSTNQIVGSVPVPAGTVNVEFAFGSMWVTTDKAVIRLDPDTGDTLATLPVVKDLDVRYVQALRGGFDSMWLHARAGTNDTVIRVDPATNTITTSILTGTAPDATHLRTDFVFAGGAGWTCANDAALIRIDPTSNSVTDRYLGTPKGGCALDATEDAIWFAPYAGKDLYRLPLP